jgi:hypothetical protein
MRITKAVKNVIKKAPVAAAAALEALAEHAEIAVNKKGELIIRFRKD